MSVSHLNLWFNGKFMPWPDAQVHVMTHALHYGSSVFEGIRAYNTPKGVAIFRLEEHIDRLFDSAKIYHITIPYSRQEIMDACCQCVKDNNLESAYIRPLVFIGDAGLGIYKLDPPIEVMIAAFPWGSYLGEEGVLNGIDACVASWNRVAPNTIPTAAKAGGNYLSSQLIAREARSHGYDEGIGLDSRGFLGEGAGENLFLIRNNIVYTPSNSSSILPGITRATVITLLQDLGYEVREETMQRESLYLVDEIFMTGTAAEVTPIKSVDRLPVGDGTVGPVTKAVQKAFFDLVKGQSADKHNWLTLV